MDQNAYSSINQDETTIVSSHGTDIVMKRPRREERRQTKKTSAEEGSWTRCMFFQAQKKRYCNLYRSPASNFCGHHATTAINTTTATTATSSLRLRIQCPIDASHSIYADDLRGHSQRCASATQASVLQKQPFYRRNANAGASNTYDTAAVTRVRAAITKNDTGDFSSSSLDVLLLVPPQAEQEEDSDANDDGDTLPKPSPPPTITTTTASAGNGGGGGALSRLIDCDINDLGVDIPKLATRLLVWALSDAPPSDHGDTLYMDAATPLLNTALAATNHYRGTKKTTTTAPSTGTMTSDVNVDADANADAADTIVTTKNAAASIPSTASVTLISPSPTNESVKSALNASGKATAFRHQVQQVSIVTHLMHALGALKSTFDDENSQLSSDLGLRLLKETTSDALALLRDEAIFLELGAGSGGLSHTLSAVLPKASLVLVDRAPVGVKVDKALRREGAASTFSRVRIDLIDVHLPGIAQLWGAPHTGTTSSRLEFIPAAVATMTPTPTSSSSPPPPVLRIAALGKHLCGGATDVSLRALATTYGGGSSSSGNGISHYAGDNEDDENVELLLPRPSVLTSPTTGSTTSIHSRSAELAAIAIATCCHHSCTWESYVGKRWWKTVLGATAGDFEVAARLTSWMVLEKGFVEKKEIATASTKIPTTTTTATATSSTTTTAARSWADSLDPAARARVGRAAKRAIDAGRADFIHRAFSDSYRLESKLLTFCDAQVSLENCLLLAQRVPS